MTCSFCHQEVQIIHRVKADGEIICCCADFGCQDDFADYLDFGVIKTERVTDADISAATRLSPECQMS